MQQSLSKSIGDLEKRDRETSDKLNSTFAKIDSRLEAAQLQAATVESMQPAIHGVVAKQHDMDRVRVDVQSFVDNALSNMESNTRQGQGPCEQFEQH